MKRSVQTFLSPAIFLMLACSCSSAYAESRAAAEYVPQRAIALLSISNGNQRIAELRDWVESTEFAESDVVRSLDANPGFLQGKIAVMGFMAAAGIDIWNALGAVVGRDLAVSVMPGEAGKRQVLLALVTHEPDVLDRLLRSIHALTGLLRDGKPDESRSFEVDGVRIFNAAPNIFHGRVDDALLIATSRDLISEALQLRKKPDDSLARSAAYAAARKRVPPDAAAWARIDTKSLQPALPNGAKPDGPRDNPLGGFLFGKSWQTILSSDDAVVWLVANGGSIALEARVTASAELPEHFRGFAASPVAGPRWNAAELPRFLSEIQVSRDWAALFGAREALLTTAGASQALQFTSTLSTLFGGMDFLNDVLPQTGAPTRLIAARQEFDRASYDPSPRLPAFALVQPLTSAAAADFSQRLSSATQMALSLLSLDMAQKGLPTYLLDVDRYREQRILFSTFSAPPSTSGMKMDAPRSASAADRENGIAAEPEKPMQKAAEERKASIRYNFLPAACVVERQYVVATSRELLEDIVDAILKDKQSADRPKAADVRPMDSMVLELPSLTELLRENRSELVLNRMLEESESKAQAQRTIDTILALLEYGRSVKLTAQTVDRELRATLALTLREAGAAKR